EHGRFHCRHPALLFVLWLSRIATLPLTLTLAVVPVLGLRPIRTFCHLVIPGLRSTYLGRRGPGMVERHYQHQRVFDDFVVDQPAPTHLPSRETRAELLGAQRPDQAASVVDPDQGCYVGPC